MSFIPEIPVILQPHSFYCALDEKRIEKKIHWREE